MFEVGDFVSVTETVTINYRDCSPAGIYKIPAGSVGTVISKRNHFSTDYKYAVRFRDIPNYPGLFFEGAPIGPGHYIGEKSLKINHKVDHGAPCINRDNILIAANDDELRDFLFS